MLATLCAVRGYKNVAEHFPHDCALFTVALGRLERHETFPVWTTEYILLLWLAMTLYAPFDLTRMSLAGDPIQRVLTVVYRALSSSSRVRDAAAYVLAKLFSRRDVAHHVDYINDFVARVKQAVTDGSTSGLEAGSDSKAEGYQHDNIAPELAYCR